MKIPVLRDSISAGFPSPAEDFIESYLDLNKLLIKHPAASYFMRVKGDSMINVGIFSGDLILVDRSLTPANGKIVVASINNEYTVKKYYTKNNAIYLIPANKKYNPIKINPDDEFKVFGIVTTIIRQLAV